MGQPIKNIVDYERFFSKEINDLLSYISEDYLQTFPVKEITTEMFFSAAFTVDTCMIYRLFDCFLNSFAITSIQNKLSSLLQEQMITAIKPGRKIDYSKELKNLFTKSLTECTENGCDFITSDHVLLALLNTNNGNEYMRVKKIFNEQGVNYSVALERSKKIHEITNTLNNDDEIEGNIEEIYDDDESYTQATPIAIRISGNPDELKNLNLPKLLGDFMSGEGEVKKPQTKEKASKNNVQYCTNLNEEAKLGKIDCVVGREKEINRIIKILNRRDSNNVLLIGNAGCGKTTIVRGLAKRINDGVAPSAISDYTILHFNVVELVSGTRLRGMVESRMTTLYKDIKKRQNTILFIDDFHSFFNEKKDDDYNMIPLLLQFLQDKDCKVIAATTYKGYKNSIEKNPDISSRFNKVHVEEPNLEESKQILSSLKNIYEKYHHIIVSDEIVNLILTLCKRYETQKSLISSALDVLDEIGSKKHIDKQETQEIVEKRHTLENALENKDSDEIIKLRLELTKLLNSLPDDETYVEVTQDDVYTTFSEYENVPISKLNVSEKQQISQIDKTLGNSIIGQEEAIKVVSRAIKRNKVGLSSHTKPLASFLMVGKTGVGKTLLAKMLAKEIYCDEKNLVRFDMSEYADKTSVNKLIGSSAGYVGYNDGGLLTEAIKSKKHCVLLFDEIEKADEEVFNLFLQIFDEGFLTDNTGQRVDFRDTIIILTSNVGTKLASETRSFGFNKDDTQTKKDVIERELKKKFPPEFINRLDDIVYFNSLTDDDLKKIIELELNKLKDRVKEAKYDMRWDEGTVSFILNSISEEKEYGARPIIRSIQDNVENRITDIILENEDVKEGHEFNINFEEGKLVIE